MARLSLPQKQPDCVYDFANSGRIYPTLPFRRASAGTYFNEQGVLSTAPNNIPRMDYDPETGKCLGLLVERNSANLFNDSTGLANYAANGTATTVLTPTTDPLFPGHTVRGFTGAAFGSGVYFYRGDVSPLNLTNNPLITFSMFVKSESKGLFMPFIHMYDSNMVELAVPYIQIDLTTDTIVVVHKPDVLIKTTITNMRNGWKRVSILLNPPPTVVRVTPCVYSAPSSGGNFTGWFTGVQIEQGALTSYIPTNGVAVDRAADIFDLGSQTYRSLVGDFTMNHIGTPGGSYFMYAFSNSKVGEDRMFRSYKHPYTDAVPTYWSEQNWTSDTVPFVEVEAKARTSIGLGLSETEQFVAIDGQAASAPYPGEPVGDGGIRSTTFFPHNASGHCRKLRVYDTVLSLDDFKQLTKG